MLASIALTPSAPVLVPELAGAAAAEVADIRAAATTAASALPGRWIVIGVGPADAVISGGRGTFAGYGADVEVSLSPDSDDRVMEMPLCAVFAAWLRGQANPEARIEVRVCAADLGVDAAVDRGRSLRAEIERADGPTGVLVVADGFTTIGPSAPGGEDPAAEAAQTALDDALAAGDPAPLLSLPAGVAGRVAYQVLAGLAEEWPRTAVELIRGAPFGVGYFVGLWRTTGPALWRTPGPARPGKLPG